ncbi:ABC-2 transporter permease [Intestinibacillus massiliensis]|uniref:ABC-2 transporter permease n=1 Tax=Intestinibacillus massiliensis TaxID=1871029 RepID=UPI000B356290|nr:ABC-2 transporter permease [Intestinibacillus massiliensis]MCB6365022.1 ABC-2 transporter permease [Intestinibacillus massiliensis]
MKAILRSDFLNMLQSAKTMGILVIFFAALALFTQNVSFLGTFLVMVWLIVPFNLFSYDTAYGWDKLTLSLPISRSSVILSKYLLCAGLGLALLVFSGAVSVLYCLQYPGESLPSLFAMLLLCTSVALLLLAIMLPLVVKFGVTKGRYILLAVVWLPILLLFFLKGSGTSNPFDGLDALQAVGRLLPFSALLLVVCLACYAVSALLSIQIYRRKEF